MTTVSYSDDLHKRAIEYVCGKQQPEKGSRGIWGVSATTMSRWQLAHKKEGRKLKQRIEAEKNDAARILREFEHFFGHKLPVATIPNSF